MQAAVPVSARWDPDVLDLARSRQIEVYLEPLWQMTWRQFPAAESVKVIVYQDHELPDLKYILFEVRIAHEKVPDYVQARHQWIDWLGTYCSSNALSDFGLYLETV
jgi:hypothetical protein